MKKNKNSLLVVDSPYVLYIYTLISCPDITDIFVLLGERYSVNEYKKFISYIVQVNKVRNVTYFTDDFKWNSVRNASTMASVKSSLEGKGVNEIKINQYNNIYLNSYGSAIGFYLSTVRPYIAMQHSVYDILRHYPIQYFFESVKLLIKCKKIRHRYLSYCMANTLESTPKKYTFYKPFSSFFNDKFYQSYANNKALFQKNKNIGILLWTSHYSYNDPFNIEFINLNKKIFELAYKDFSNNLDCLIIKLHHRIPRPDSKELSRIKLPFEKLGLNVVLFDEIFNYDQPSRIYPIEMVINIFNTSFIVGACSSAVWNCSEKLSNKTFSAFEFDNLRVGRLKFVINGWKKMNKKLKYIPNDLSTYLNESK